MADGENEQGRLTRSPCRMCPAAFPLTPGTSTEPQRRGILWENQRLVQGPTVTLPPCRSGRSGGQYPPASVIP